MNIIRTTEEIERVLELADEGENFGTKYRSLNYEQGIKALYGWLTESEVTHPFEE